MHVGLGRTRRADTLEDSTVFLFLKLVVLVGVEGKRNVTRLERRTVGVRTVAVRVAVGYVLQTDGELVRVRPVSLANVGEMQRR